MPFKTTANWLFHYIWRYVLTEKLAFFNKQLLGFIISLMRHLLRCVVSVTHTLNDLKVVPIAKVVVLVSEQLKWAISFICRWWYPNTKYTGLLTYTVFRKSRFCCSVRKLVSSSFFSIFLQHFLIVFLYYEHY